LCDILDCRAEDLIEPVTGVSLQLCKPRMDQDRPL
jgi:hypothetical protein